jgi:cytochrome c-type biogenesis protein
VWSYGISFVAGLVTVLSPCVLPVLPIVVGSAGQQHRHGPMALAAGLITSFVAVGMSISSVGIAIGFDGSIVRFVAATLLILVGAVLLSARLGHRFENAAAPLASRADRIMKHSFFTGLKGQFFVGALLGAIWSPCTGPTLGAAIGMAAQSGAQLKAAGIMIFFGLGASVPVLAIGYGAKSLLTRNRAHLLKVGEAARQAIGFILVIVGALVLAGFDKKLETLLLQNLPSGWVDLITQF